jgi:hypothetical protein
MGWRRVVPVGAARRSRPPGGEYVPVLGGRPTKERLCIDN